MRRRGLREGFSLVEVVLAIGIVSFALMVIFGLFGNSLRTQAETVSQQEALGLSRSLPGALVTNPVTTTTDGFAEVCGWVKSGTAPEILAFMNTNGAFRIAQAGNFTASEIANRGGRLFRIVPSLSPNMPMVAGNGSMIPRPSPSDLPDDPANFTNSARLPLQIQIFEVATPGLPIENRAPVLTYDTAIGRF